MNNTISIIVRYITTTICIVVGLMIATVWSESLSNTSMTVEIINSYAAVLQLSSSWQAWNWWYDWSTYRTNQQQATIRIAASEKSDYVLSWDFVWSVVSGSGVWWYTSDYPIELLSTSGLHHISIIYMKWTEPNIPKPIIIGVDQQAPSQPILITPDNTVFSGDVTFDRWLSFDTGVWLSSYTLMMGLTPSLANMVAMMTTGTSITIASDDLPSGTIYRTILAKDHLGNQSEYMIGYIHHQLPTMLENKSSVVWSYDPKQQNISSYVPDTVKWDTPTNILPIYVMTSTWSIHEVANIVCPWLRIHDLKYCHEWDLDIDILSNNRIIATNIEVAWDESIDILYQEQVAAGSNPNNLIWDIDHLIIFTPLKAAMYERYFAAPVQWWILPKTWINHSILQDYSEPDYHNYELVMNQYGESFTPHTTQFSRYLVLIGIFLIWLTRWFFREGYHHRYIVKYSKSP